MITGLLHALVLDEKGGARAIQSSEDLHNWQPEHGKLWVHIDYSQTDVVNWLKHCELLTDYELESFTADETRPRITQSANGHMLFLRGVNLNPAQSPEDMVSVRLFINENIVITSRKRRLLSIDDVLSSLKDNKGPCSISELVCAITQKLTSRMQSVINSLDETLDGFEEEIDEKAIEHYSKALELDPKHDSAWNNRGNSYSDQKEYDKAIEDYSKAVSYTHLTLPTSDLV